MNETFAANKKKTAKNFSQYFSKIVSKIDETTPKSKCKIRDYLKNENLNSLLRDLVDEKEMKDTISNTANNKAIGLNSVSPSC